MKYIIFDLDGVILSERRCFDTSALVLWDLLRGDKYFNLGAKFPEPLTAEEIAKLREYFWLKDEILIWLKAKGINSNGDMIYAYLLAMISLLQERKPAELNLNNLSPEEFLGSLGRFYQEENVTPQDIFAYLQKLTKPTAKKKEFFAALIGRTAELCQVHPESLKISGELYAMVEGLFNLWYKNIENLYPKEEVLAPKDKLVKMFKELQSKGFTLCIGTGRPMQDVYVPLQELGIFHYFGKNHVATYDDALMAEILTGMGPLNKPHPFIFRAAWWGTQPERYEKYVKNPQFYTSTHDGDEVYVVGDSVADVHAAREMGVKVFATLTGLGGTKDEEMLKEAGATEIINNVLDLQWHI